MAVQLTINGVDYPKTSHDRYKCYRQELGERLRMASGKMVFEKRGQAVVIEYSYDYFDDDMRAACLSAMRGGNVLQVTYLDADTNTMKTGRFLCTKQPTPTFAFGIGNTPYWHGYAFTLEGVDVV